MHDPSSKPHRPQPSNQLNFLPHDRSKAYDPLAIRQKKINRSFYCPPFFYQLHRNLIHEPWLYHQGITPTNVKVFTTLTRLIQIFSGIASQWLAQPDRTVILEPVVYLLHDCSSVLYSVILYDVVS
jgi:hypothetical protein